MWYYGLPTGIETLERHSRLTNWLLVAVLVVVFLLTGMGANLEEDSLQPWILNGWSPKGMIGSLFLHADWLHLVGNAFFLIVFGNVVCQTVGGWKYLLLFCAAGVFADVIHLLLDGRPAIGASGAISGLCGVTLALFPNNRMDYPAGSIEQHLGGDFRVWHFCVLHFSWDIIGAVRGGAAIAYWAHLGGFAGGILLGVLCLHKGWIVLSQFDNASLYEKLTGRELERLQVEVDAESDTHEE
jgi:membrane associated rhomboid family serine protease